MLVFKRYNSYMTFSDDLKTLKLHSWNVSGGTVYAVFDVEDTSIPAFENVVMFRPSVSQQLQEELEPLPGHDYKWDAGDVKVRKHGAE